MAGTAAGTGRADAAGGIAQGDADMAVNADAAVLERACSSSIAACTPTAGTAAGTGRAAEAGGIDQGDAPTDTTPAAAAAAATVGEPAELSPLRCEKQAGTVARPAGPEILLMAFVSLAAGAGARVTVGVVNATMANAASFSSEETFLAGNRRRRHGRGRSLCQVSWGPSVSAGCRG
ncbi:unnamed protein product, partial [Ectocarpus fasciculatus]